ncbi:MAG TPA: CBS domain-containing protein [Trebonia sp.]|nr:CBS domain-containing protein [Trebonia sp.]
MSATVRSVMTRDPVAVRAFTPYKQIVRLLVGHGISAVPVVDEAGRVLGVVSQADLIERRARHGGPAARALRPTTRRTRASRIKANAVSAGTLMTGPAVTVRPDAGLDTAARLMSRHGVKRLPVVDAEGRLVGVVSRGDLLTPYLRADAEIFDEILNRILMSEMCVDPHSVDVAVVDGVATLSGRMENWFVARDTAARVRGLDGVIEVVDHLTPDVQEDRAGPLPFPTPLR